LCREGAALFVARQDGAETIADACKSLMQRHAGSARIGEYRVNPVVNEALHEDIGTGLGTVGEWFGHDNRPLVSDN
jgi:hypothetical protein